MNTTTAPTDELHTLALMIDEIRNAKGWSVGELMRRHASNGLGSDKTWNKILKRDFSEMKVEDRVTSYRHVLNLLHDTREESAEEPVYSDLSGPTAVRKGLTRAMMTATVARVGIIEGESGMGKSSCLAVVRQIYGKRIVEMEIRAAWKDSPSAFLGQLLIELGEQPGPNNAARRQRKVEEVLKGSRRCLLLEEAHHLGPRCIDVIKNLINQTKGEAVLAAIPTLLRKVEREAYEESLQLFRNRLAFRVKLKLTKPDVLLLITRRMPAKIEDEDQDKVADLLVLNGPKNGYFAFTREVCRRVRETWAEEVFGSRVVTFNDVVSAAQTEIAERAA